MQQKKYFKKYISYKIFKGKLAVIHNGVDIKNKKLKKLKHLININQN